MAPLGDPGAFVAAAVEVATDTVRRRAMGVAARHAVVPLRPECVARDFVGALAGLTA